MLQGGEIKKQNKHATYVNVFLTSHKIKGNSSAYIQCPHYLLYRIASFVLRRFHAVLYMIHGLQLRAKEKRVHTCYVRCTTRVFLDFIERFKMLHVTNPRQIARIVFL